jgi:hypothetical protein
MTFKTKRKLWLLQTILMQQGRKIQNVYVPFPRYFIETDSDAVTIPLSATKENHKTEQFKCLKMRSRHYAYYVFTKIQTARQIIVNVVECSGTLKCNGWSDDMVNF